jgi:hypothetical protein
LTSVRVSFHYSDYYSLSDPNPAGCAGDAKNYYSAIATEVSTSGAWVPQVLETSLTDPTTTIRPSFIKNISVDLTDSNSSTPSNHAMGCSYGTGASAPPATHCSSFDYGDNNGVDSGLAGSIVLIGGVTNSQGLEVSCSTVDGFYTNSCPISAYALAVDTLPASSATNPPNSLVPGLTSASGPISSWANLAATSSTGATYSGPAGLAGASGVFDEATQSLALFGGSAVLSNVGGVIQAASSDTTWKLDLSTQTWSSALSNPVVDLGLERTFEQDSNGSRYLSNVTTARANFGYVALPGISLSAMSADGTVASGNIDTTDRIIVAGGQDASGYVTDTHKFNPTYGPEWFDTLQRSTGAPASGELVQWLGSYETQLMNNTQQGSLLEPVYPTGGSNPPQTPGTSFGMTALRNNSSGPGSGYLLMIGGFNPALTGANATESCNSSNNYCAMMISTRAGETPGSGGSTETMTANFSSVGNLLNIPASGITQLAPSVWTSYTGTPGPTTGVPWYGGSTLLQGFSLNDNDVVYFGGSTCNAYLAVGQTGCDFANPGRYYRMGSNPVASSATVPSGGNDIAFTGTPPPAAGMAAARGLDPSGNVMIVAFGGMTSVATGTDPSIYYLYNAGSAASPTPTWVKTTVSGGGPAVSANGAMVFSHVTHKFYLFGGYSSTAGRTLGDTWELSVSGANCATNGSCTFSWRQLNVTNGLACFPTTCPTARRSHRMVEANYSNTDPTAEPSCTSGAPCSFGIFMEGGTADGVNPLTDRWMFDPTANSGYGLWQKLSEMPARTLAAMTAVDYVNQKTSLSAHRAVLFGGEMGLQNPVNASIANSFVAPTLDDTWIYDFDNNTWNRVSLLGQGYNGTPVVSSELENRQAYDATDRSTPAATNLSELSPPPTAGAMMVTRTLSSLKIPEVFLIGGRKKDGSYQNFDHVYKFCIASTGEAYTGGDGVSTYATADTTTTDCDAYDPDTNPYSPSPITTGYVGRWLRKEPSGGSTLASYLGGAAYDNVNDLIAVFGGLQPTSGSGFVTDTTNQSVSSLVSEYTPPKSGAREGSWAQVPACVGSAVPVGRYGNTLSFDSRNQQLISVGGYSIAGTPLTSTVTYYDGRTYTVPEIWAAKRAVVSGIPCYTWRSITTFGNSIDDESQVPPQTGLGFFSGIYIPSNGYNTGYYSMFDSSCVGAGPISSPDPTVNKTLAGGVYIDIDRSQLGENENLLLNLTFLPLSQGNLSSNATQLSSSDEALFKVHLVKTGQSSDVLKGILQPRFLSYTANSSYPETVQTLAVLAPPTGQVRQEQLYIPLSTDPDIDRIRIERVSGSGILVEASLFRLGHP